MRERGGGHGVEVYVGNAMGAGGADGRSASRKDRGAGVIWMVVIAFGRSAPGPGAEPATAGG